VTPPEETERVARALASLESPAQSATPLVRIDQLFYADQGPHVVERAGAPPLDAAARLQRELTTRSEHLKRLIAEAREASDPVASARVRRELRTTTRELETLSASFGAHQLSAFFAESGDLTDQLNSGELDALDTACRVMAAPFNTMDELERRIAVVQRTRRATPARAVANVAATRATPTGSDLQRLLETGIEGFRQLDEELSSEAANIGSGEVVAIDSLLFRGPSAISRAIELREQLRSRGTPEDDSLREIFDLLDLARAE
jgi:hypothetical protein